MPDVQGHAEVINIEDGHYATYEFDGWREYSELKSLMVDDDADDWISAVNFDLQIPRIVRLLRYDRLPKSAVKFNRRNIFLRDEHRCQYCGQQFSAQRLSLDHVLPRSRGGPTTWENIVCGVGANVRKGGRTPSSPHGAAENPAKPNRNPVISRQLDDVRYHCWRSFLPGHGD
ncbi:MAG: HNH endonuclease [Planctomycetaceae bacterium]